MTPNLAEIGIFAKTFHGESLAARFDAARHAGFESVHFDFEMLGGDSVPEEISDDTIAMVRRTADQCGVRFSSIEGVYNMAHPDPAVRAEGHRRLTRLIASARALGSDIVTLCTGSRADGMWRPHADNSTESAWRDMRASVSSAVEVAEDHGVTLLVECEHNNVVSDARRGRRILDEIGSDNLRIVLDAANIVGGDELDRQDELLRESFNLLGPDIVMAHGKDRTNAGVVPAGTGLIDYPLFVALLAGIAFSGVIVLHSLGERDVPAARKYVSGLVDDAYADGPTAGSR
jgi:sugar phosphate isomerase/epimerase